MSSYTAPNLIYSEGLDGRLFHRQRGYASGINYALGRTNLPNTKNTNLKKKRPLKACARRGWLREAKTITMFIDFGKSQHKKRATTWEYCNIHQEYCMFIGSCELLGFHKFGAIETKTTFKNIGIFRFPLDELDVHWFVFESFDFHKFRTIEARNKHWNLGIAIQTTT